MKKEKPDFREIINKARKEKDNMSIAQLGRLVDCHDQTIHRYLSGKSNIGSHFLEKICGVLGIEVESSLVRRVSTPRV